MRGRSPGPPSPPEAHQYGDSAKVRGTLEKFYPKFAGGDVIEPHDFAGPYFWNEAGAMQWHFDDAYEIKGLVDKHGPEHIAAEGQRVLEEQTKEIVFPWLDKEQTRNLSCAGGVFLNVKLNQRIWESGKVEHHHIYPNAGDSGLAAGAALYAYYQANPDAPIHNIQDLYWGPEYSEKEIEKVIRT